MLQIVFDTTIHNLPQKYLQSNSVHANISAFFIHCGLCNIGGCISFIVYEMAEIKSIQFCKRIRRCNEVELCNMNKIYGIVRSRIMIS